MNNMPRHVLVIDDDDVDRMMVSRLLRGTGKSIHVDECAEGYQGISLAKINAYDCIVVDYVLPDVTGVDLIKELYGLVKQPTALIMLTGEGNELIAVEAMKSGAHDYLPKKQLTPGMFERVLRSAMEKCQLQWRLAEYQKQLEHMALYDLLTGLGNRNLFRRELDRAIAIAQRQKSSFSILMIDLNRFKEINDHYGHDAGDAILSEVGHRLSENVRSSDAYFRIGGDEFIGIIGPNSDEQIVIKKIKELLSISINFQGHDLSVSASIGMANYPDNGEASTELIRAADHEMYKDKHRQTD
jgi:diguanylate cyclase (GGDEF)-like protein